MLVPGPDRILTTAFGKPFTPKGFGNWMADKIGQSGVAAAIPIICARLQRGAWPRATRAALGGGGREWGAVVAGAVQVLPNAHAMFVFRVFVEPLTPGHRRAACVCANLCGQSCVLQVSGPCCQKGKERKSIALAFMRDVQGSATRKLTMFEKVGAAAGFARARRTWQSPNVARVRGNGEA